MFNSSNPQRLFSISSSSSPSRWLLLATLAGAGCASSGSGKSSAGAGGAPGIEQGGSSASNGGSAGGSAEHGGSSSGGSAGGAFSCMTTTGGGVPLPASFFSKCSGCHSAYGTPANPAVPNLFATKPGSEAFTQTVRAGKASAGKLPMPAFTESQISSADLAQMQAYFAAGAAGDATSCQSPDGNDMSPLGTCSGMTVSYARLFKDGSTSLEPIAKVDPATQHLIFRGAGRVRFRHEMEESFAIYHDHYFEGRTFGYILDDSIPAGGSTITITFLPSGNQVYTKQTNALLQLGYADLNIRAWKLYGHPDGNAFGLNAGGADNTVVPFGCEPDPNGPNCNTRKYVYTITRNGRDKREIRMGDQLQVEFGMFLARYNDGKSVEGPPLSLNHVRNILPIPAGCTLNGPPWNNQCYTQANYYSDSFRYVVGKGTVTPYNEDCTMGVPLDEEKTTYGDGCGPDSAYAKAVAAGTLPDRIGPDEPGWSGGTSTLAYMRFRPDMYYSQLSPAVLQENAEAFTQGRRLFHTDYTTGEHTEKGNGLTAPELAVHADIAGPYLNQVACEGCHVHNGRGVAPPAGTAFDSMVVRLYGKGTDEHGGPLPDASYGRQLQPKAVKGAGEGKASFKYDSVAGAFGDGTPYTLSKPTATFSDMAAGAPASYSVRLARPLIGMGLLEAIPESEIVAHADPTDCDHDGISGVPNIVFDPEDGKMHLGRFGWKAAKASVRHQVTEAASFDLGVTSSVFPKHECGTSQLDCLAADKPQPELSDSDVNLLVTYLRDLAVPPRRDLKVAQVVRGEALFSSLGCVSCHAPNQHTGKTSPFLELRDQVIHPYSDLLLHDMGPDLADAAGQPEFVAQPSEWRTPPLWGIGLCDEVSAGFQMGDDMNPAPNLGPCHYLHDGRAASLVEAVLWHGGEAKSVRDQFVALAAPDRDALVAFLKSL